MSTAGLWTSRMAMFSCCTSSSSYCVPVWPVFLILMKSMSYCVVIAMEAYMSSISISTQKSRIQNNWIGNAFMRWMIHNSNRFFPHSLLDNLIMYWEKSIIMILLPHYFIGMNACILVVMMVESICTPLTPTHPPSRRRSTIRSKLWNKSLECLWRGITPLLFVDSWIMSLFSTICLWTPFFIVFFVVAGNALGISIPHLPHSLISSSVLVPMVIKPFKFIPMLNNRMKRIALFLHWLFLPSILRRSMLASGLRPSTLTIRWSLLEERIERWN